LLIGPQVEPFLQFSHVPASDTQIAPGIKLRILIKVIKELRAMDSRMLLSLIMIGTTARRTP